MASLRGQQASLRNSSEAAVEFLAKGGIRKANCPARLNSRFLIPVDSQSEWRTFFPKRPKARLRERRFTGVIADRLNQGTRADLWGVILPRNLWAPAVRVRSHHRRLYVNWTINATCVRED
jgi:hypothetical protein